jgi:alpha-beta hydrolase superfamily lysophospholipase
MVKDLELVWKWGKKQHYSKLATIGLSLGGLVTLCATLQDRQGAIFWAPGLFPKKLTSPLRRILGKFRFALNPKPIEVDHSGIGPKLLFGNELLDSFQINTIPILKNFTLPTLILQGTEDRVVQPRITHKAFELMPQDEKHQLKFVEGAPHDFIDAHLEEFIKHSLEFLHHYLK